jgi:hypothetical protein
MMSSLLSPRGVRGSWGSCTEQKGRIVIDLVCCASSSPKIARWTQNSWELEIQSRPEADTFVAAIIPLMQRV